MNHHGISGKHMDSMEQHRYPKLAVLVICPVSSSRLEEWVGSDVEAWIIDSSINQWHLQNRCVIRKDWHAASWHVIWSGWKNPWSETATKRRESILVSQCVPEGYSRVAITSILVQSMASDPQRNISWLGGLRNILPCTLWASNLHFESVGDCSFSPTSLSPNSA